jgi:hypothetical protein
MSTASIEPTTRAIRTGVDEPDPQRFKALGVIGIAQLKIPRRPTVASKALVHGYSVGFTVIAAILLAAAIIAGSLVKASRFDVPSEEPAMAVSGAAT